MSAAATPPVEMLPRRTWRRWWLARPRWVRIGVWALAGLFALHVALAVRIAVGLIESKEIAEFRRLRSNRGTTSYIGYQPNFGSRPEWFRGHRLLLTGLYGRSNSHVVTIMKDGATEADLNHIGRHFPNLEHLELYHPNLTASGLDALRHCRRLKHLEIQFADLDDSLVAPLVGLESLETLILKDGLISANIYALLPQLPHLKNSDISDYGQQPAGIEDDSAGFSIFELTVRWADGERSANFARWNYLVAEVPNPKNGVRIRPLMADWRLEASRYGIRSNLKNCGDGDYRFYFRVGEFDAEPLTVRIVDGLASTRRLEFQMPVTKAEAMK